MSVTHRATSATPLWPVVSVLSLLKCVCVGHSPCTEDGSSNTCPYTNQVLPSTTVCRTANGLCDAPEMCTGTSTMCPADAYYPMGRTCRPAVGPCDVAELCSGASPQCPSDMVRTSVCAW
jgi:hypothetical protein